MYKGNISMALQNFLITYRTENKFNYLKRLEQIEGIQNLLFLEKKPY